MKCTGIVYDKMMQGLLKPSFNIDGRVKPIEVEKFIGEVKASSKRQYAVFRLQVDVNSAETASSYTRFCDEYVKAVRLGVCPVAGSSKDVQVYIVPPGLKKTMSVLSAVEDGGFGCLYAMVTFKNNGPDRMVKASQEIDASSFGGDPKRAQPAPSVSTMGTGGLGLGWLPPSGSSTPSIQPGSFPFPNPIANPNPNPPPPQAPGVVPSHNPNLPLQPLGPPPNDQAEMILRVAHFCAGKGVQTLKEMQSRERSRELMPFLYEESGEGYKEFIKALRQCVKNKSGSGAGAPPSSSFPLNSSSNNHSNFHSHNQGNQGHQGGNNNGNQRRGSRFN